MGRSIHVATIQMNGAPAPRAKRLAQAETSIAEAVAQGAQLVVLPASFNMGKSFDETRYERTERLSDPTTQWLQQQARTHGMYIAGAYLVIDQADTYQRALLTAPDGQTWHYDQQYPHLWDRAFYRDGQKITVADTDLGKIGMLIGWDCAHPDLWERYASKIDLMLTFHDEPDYSQAQLRDGAEVIELSRQARRLGMTSAQYTRAEIMQQSAWLQVPVVSAGLSGQFESILPAPFFSVYAVLWSKPTMWQQANSGYAQMQLCAPFQAHTHISDSVGQTIASVTETNEAIISATLTLPDHTPLPDSPQPPSLTMESTRLTIDLLSSALLRLTYQRGVRRQWGARMAPLDRQTRIWRKVLLVSVLLALIIGRAVSAHQR
ncbi:MAG: carbon-nitrogen hydrolase family protein [Anaerolineae bacterium]